MFFSFFEFLKLYLFFSYATVFVAEWRENRLLSPREPILFLSFS